MPLSPYWPFHAPTEAPTPKPVIKQPKCPICGSSGVPIFNMFQCSNKSCRNYKAPTGPHYVWEPEL